MHYLPLNTKDDRKHTRFILQHQNQGLYKYLVNDQSLWIRSQNITVSITQMLQHQRLTILKRRDTGNSWHKPGVILICSNTVKMRSGWQCLLPFIHFDVSSSLVQTTSVISDMLDNSFQQQWGKEYFGFFMPHHNLGKQDDIMHLNLLAGSHPQNNHPAAVLHRQGPR